MLDAILLVTDDRELERLCALPEAFTIQRVSSSAAESTAPGQYIVVDARSVEEAEAWLCKGASLALLPNEIYSHLIAEDPRAHIYYACRETISAEQLAARFSGWAASQIRRGANTIEILKEQHRQPDNSYIHTASLFAAVFSSILRRTQVVISVGNSSDLYCANIDTDSGRALLHVIDSMGTPLDTVIQTSTVNEEDGSPIRVILSLPFPLHEYRPFEQDMLQSAALDIAHLLALHPESKKALSTISVAAQVVHSLNDTQQLLIRARQTSEGLLLLFAEGAYIDDLGLGSRRHGEKYLSKVLGDILFRKLESNISQALSGGSGDQEFEYAGRWYRASYKAEVSLQEVTISIIDITDLLTVQHDLRASEERFRILVESLPVGILWEVYDGSSVTNAYMNATGLRIIGYTLEEYVDQQSRDYKLLHPDDYDRVHLAWYRWLNDPDAESQLVTRYRMRRKDGQWIWLQNIALRFSPTPTSEMHILQVTQDITESVKAQQQALEALEKERSLNSLQRRFATVVSHEFRTPLAGILSSAQIIQRYKQKLTPELLDEEANKIKLRVAEMNELIHSFVHQSSARKLGELTDLGPRSARHVVETVIHELSEYAGADISRVQVRLPDHLPKIEVDERLLAFILRAFLSNALRYSSAEVEVSAQANGVHCAIHVKDAGIGIPAHEKSHLYSPFFRGSNTQGTRGMGIDLSLAKELAQKIGATIAIESVENIGTTASVEVNVHSY